MSTNPPPLKPRTKPKGISPLLMVAVALLLALSAALSIWNYLRQTEEEVKKLTATRSVVVAARDIAAGTKLKPEDLTIQEFPYRTVPQDYPDKTDLVVGRIIKYPVLTNEVIAPEKLVKVGAAGGLAGLIPKGQRAITIMVDEITGVGGFISPGDTVDVLTEYQKVPPGGTETKQYSRTILQNVFVLAAGDKLYDPSVVAEPITKVVNQITFALTPEDSERLSLAARQGTIRLVLRPHGEFDINENLGVGSDELFKTILSTEPTEVNKAGPEPVVISEIPEIPEDVPTISRNLDRNGIDIILGSYRTFINY